MKKLYSLFAAAIFSIGVMAQTTVTEIAAEQFGTSSVSNIEGTYPIDSNLNYTIISNGANPPAFYPADGIRLYSVRTSGEGNILTITPLNNVKITAITLNASSTNYTPKLTYSIDGGSFQSANWSGTTLTISGIEAAKSLAIKNAHTGGNSNVQLRVTSFSVTYDATTLSVPDIKKSKQSLVKNTSVENDLVFAAKSDVKVYNVNGQVVKSASVNENTSLNVSTWPKGIYIVSGNVDGEAVSQKIIKK